MLGLRDANICTSCCNYATLSTAGVGQADILETSGLPRNHRSFLIAGGVQGVGNIKFNQSQRRDSQRTEIRASYSPLVESFEGVQHRSDHVLEALKNPDGSGLSGSLSPQAEVLLSESFAVPPGNHAKHLDHRQSHEDIDKVQVVPRDPAAAVSGDNSSLAKVSDIGHDLDSKRSVRVRPPSMSLSQGFSSAVGHAVRSSVGAVGPPVKSSRIKGPPGVIMAVVVAALGLVTAVQKHGLFPRSQAPQKVCTKCDGYGVDQCHVCQGQGRINWEGKLRRADPCPLCFGSCTKKCSRCGGVRMKKGTPPGVQLRGKKV